MERITIAFHNEIFFDKIGIRNALVETDTYGNFLGQGQRSCHRDWARLGIYICKMGYGMAANLARRICGVRNTAAPAWISDGRPIYGGRWGG